MLLKTFSTNSSGVDRSRFCMIPEWCHSWRPELRRKMNQSDLLLLQTVPPDRLQALVKTRRASASLKGQNIKKPKDPSSMTITEIAQDLFDPTSCIDTLSGLAEMEKSILGELIACGGRANSRDLALYFSCLQAPLDDASEPDRKSSSLVDSSKGSPKSQPHHRLVTLQYPTPHPHGKFEQAVHRLL